MNKSDTDLSNGATEAPEETLSRLTTEQGIKPVENLDELSALWPADDDPDSLMKFVLEEV